MKVKDIRTPIPEVADRYTIAMLKADRLPAEEQSHAELQRQIDYYKAGLDFTNLALAELVDQLYLSNGKMWDIEGEIRAGQDNELGLEEIGRRALIARDINRRRSAIKNAIVDLSGDGFKDCKMNYAEGEADAGSAETS